MQQMDSKPKFSVVISTYNRREYVLEAVRSVREQTYPAHEIIVAVDGSTDGTAQELRRRFPEIIVHEQSNLGRSIARNAGVALATGGWVCFLDDDDLWHRDKLKKTVQYIIKNSDCKAVNNPLWFFAEDGNGPKTLYGFKRDFIARNLRECHEAVASGTLPGNDFTYLNIRGNSFRLLLERCRGTLSGSTVRKEVLIQAGCFCPMQESGQDWFMFINVARICEWHTIPERLVFMRCHKRQNSYNAYNGLFQLAGMINAWYAGRPMPYPVRESEILNELTKYGTIYRQTVQCFYWSALFHGRFRTARSIRLMGRLLLPKWANYLYVFIPPQITWRWEHYILGTHK